MGDLSTLMWLQWLTTGRIVRWWLRSVGYEPGSRSITERLYGLYLLLLLVPLALFSWSAALDAAHAAGAQLALEPGTRAYLMGRVPVATLAAAIAVLVIAPFRRPLRLSAVEVAHVAASPLSRRAVVLVAFLRRAVVPLVALALASSLAAVILSGAYRSDALAPLASCQIAFALMAAGFALGLWHQFHPRPGWALAASAAAVAAALAIPSIATGPGRLLAHLIETGSPAGLSGLGAADAAALAALVLAGGLARLDELDPARRRRQHRGLAASPSPLAALPTRTALHYLRHGADALTLVRDVALTFFAVHILLGATPVLPWFDWVIAAMLLGPRGITDRLAQDTREPFLRGLLPQGDLELLVDETWLGGLVAALATGALWWRFSPPSQRELGLEAVAVLLILRVACQGVSLGPSLAGRTWRPPFALATAVAFTPVMALGAAAGQPVAAMLLALSAAAGLTLWIARRA